MMMKTMFRLLSSLVLIVLLGTSTSYAASTGTTSNNPVNGGSTQSLDPITRDGDAIIQSMINRSEYDVVQDIENTFKSILTGINGYTDNIRNQTMGYGTSMLGGLAIIAFGLLGIRLGLEGGNLGSIMAELIQTSIKVGIALLFLNEYMTWFNDYLFGSFRMLADIAMPNLGSSSPEKLFTTIPVNFILLVTSSISNLMDQGWFDILTKLLPTLVLVLVLSIIMVLCGLISIVSALSAYVMMGIALAVGPIFIPWLVLQRTSFVFEGWLKFMISTGLTFFVIALITGLSVAAMNSLMIQFTGTQTHFGMASMVTANGFLPALLAGCSLGILTASLMMNASGIASKLISGGAEGIGHLGKSMSRNAGKVGDGVLNTTGSQAARVAGPVVGAVSGGVNGALASSRGGVARGKG